MIYACLIISMFSLSLLLANVLPNIRDHTQILTKFNKDRDYCIKISCKNQNKSVFLNFTYFISPLLAYGGEARGGGGASTISENKISYKTFKLCLKDKGYIKDENGIFELPYITCKKKINIDYLKLIKKIYIMIYNLKMKNLLIVFIFSINIPFICRTRKRV